MNKYIAIITYNKKIVYYSVVILRKDTEEHSRLLYKFLKAFSSCNTKAILLRGDTISSAVNELTKYLSEININEIQRKRLPHKSEDFYSWIIKE